MAAPSPAAAAAFGTPGLPGLPLLASPPLHGLGPASPALPPRQSRVPCNIYPICPARVPSLTPLRVSVPTSANSGPSAPLSLLPPGCFASRLTTVYEPLMFQAQPPTQEALGSTQREPLPLRPLLPSSCEAAPQERITHIVMSPSSSVSHGASIRGPAGARTAPLPPSPLPRAVPPGCRGARWNGLALAASDGGGCRDDRSSGFSAREAAWKPTTQTPEPYRRGALYNIISNLP